MIFFIIFLFDYVFFVQNITTLLIIPGSNFWPLLNIGYYFFIHVRLNIRGAILIPYIVAVFAPCYSADTYLLLSTDTLLFLLVVKRRIQPLPSLVVIGEILALETVAMDGGKTGTHFYPSGCSPPAFNNSFIMVLLADH